MRAFENSPRSGRSAEPGANPVEPDAGGQTGPHGLAPALAAVESALAAVRERVYRLETDVRNLQSRNTNRS